MRDNFFIVNGKKAIMHAIMKYARITPVNLLETILFEQRHVICSVHSVLQHFSSNM